MNGLGSRSGRDGERRRRIWTNYSADGNIPPIDKKTDEPASLMLLARHGRFWVAQPRDAGQNPIKELDMCTTTRRDFLKAVGLGAAGLAAWRLRPAMAEGASKAKPNVLLIIADDMCWRDCGCYGNKEVKTPNIDRLAADGMRFDAMFTATAMCAPTRQQLYTGIFPVRNGAYPNHSRVYPGTKSVVHHLKALGYRVGLIGKTHFGPRESFPFEFLPGGKGGASNTKAIADFVNRDKGKPYCLIVCSNEPHSPWSKGESGAYPPGKLTVPPYLVDTAVTRRGLSKYYAEITFLDGQVGGCMDVVEKSGRKADTMFIFTSEQGSSFPFGGKWTCYENGLKTAFVVRWPAGVKAGSATGAMAQYVDVVPTLVEAAGGEPGKIDTGRGGAPGGGRGFDGRSFLGVLLGKTDRHRDCVYGAHTTRGIINATQGGYPIRSVRSATHKYILNCNHEATFTNAATRGAGATAIWGSWVASAKTDKFAADRVKWYQHRPAEELYDLAQDPYELKNIADDPACGKVKAELKKRLLAWMAQQGDKGNETEAGARRRQGRGDKAPKAGGKRKKKADRQPGKKAGSH